MTPAGAVSTFVSSGLDDPDGLGLRRRRQPLRRQLQGNSTISKVTPAGAVSTVSSAAVLDDPDGLAFDAAGNLYVANDGDQHDLQDHSAPPVIEGQAFSGTVFHFTDADPTPRPATTRRWSLSATATA